MQNALQAKYEELPDHYQTLVDSWGADIVYHTQIPEFFQGGLSTGRVANLLSQGEGPETFRIGNKKASYAIDLVHWLWKKSEKNKGVIASNGKTVKEFAKLKDVPKDFRFAYDAKSGKILRSFTVK